MPKTYKRRKASAKTSTQQTRAANSHVSASNMHKVSAYILAYNEAEKIADAVASVLWADEVVVADSGSTDRTAAIAQGLGARVVQIPFHGFGDLRNRAIARSRAANTIGFLASMPTSDALKQRAMRSWR